MMAVNLPMTRSLTGSVARGAGACKRWCRGWVALWLAGVWTVAAAGEPEVRFVEAVASGPQTWTFHVTVRHADTGWEHYADAWRVLDAAGVVLGTRVLYHPHVDEQPFTRSLSGVAIPAGGQRIAVQAHDSVHGWGKPLAIDLTVVKGAGFSVR